MHSHSLTDWFLYVHFVLHDVRCVQCILKSTRWWPYTYSNPWWTYIYFYLAVFELVLPNLLVVFVLSVIYTWQRLWHFLHVSVFVAACQSWLVSSSIYQIYHYLCLSLSGTHWLCRLGGFHAFVIVKFPTTSPTRLFHIIAIQAMHKLRSQLYCVQFYANLGSGSQFPYSSYIGASVRLLYIYIYWRYALIFIQITLLESLLSFSALLFCLFAFCIFAFFPVFHSAFQVELQLLFFFPNLHSLVWSLALPFT